MSDPVKNAEVEDVLSSIRRLVSEDKRPLQAPKPQPQPVASDRLVLTPALRVEEAPPADDALDLAQLAIEEAVEEAVEETVEAEVQAALAADEDEAPEADAPAANKPDEPRLEEDYSTDPYDFDDEDDLDGESAVHSLEMDPPDATDSAAVDADVDALSAKIAALETAIGGIADDWEPDGASADDNAGTEPPSMAWEDIDPVEKASETSGMEEDIPDDWDETEAQVTFTHRTEAAAVDVHQVEDDVTAEAEAEVFEDDEPTMEAEPETETVEDNNAAAGIDISAEDQLLDEDTLREMITEIVHAELQGALGERITRNVRRLVRREIHRALTARDLD